VDTVQCYHNIILNKLNDNEIYIQYLIISLCHSKDKKVINTLTKLSKHKDFDIRNQAISSLEVIRDKSTIPDIEKMLNDKDHELKIRWCNGIF